MSRRARARANARPWLQQRDAGEADHVGTLLEMADDDSDEHMRELAWQQHERENKRGNDDGRTELGGTA